MTERQRILNWIENMEFLLSGNYEDSREALLFPEEQKQRIIELWIKGKRQADIAKKLGIRQPHVSALLRIEERRRKKREEKGRV